MTNRVRGTALEFEKADDPMTRINKVLEQLGGTAESQADPFTQMSNAVGDVKESIGAQLLPLITPLINGLQGFAEKLQTLNPNVVKIAALVLAAATALGVIGGPILLLIGFLPALSAGFAMLSASMGPITLVILGVAAAIAAGILIWKNWDKIMGFTSGVINGVKETFITFKDMVVGAITGIVDTIQNVFIGAIDKLKGAFSAIKEAYKTNWSWILPGGALINAFLILKALIWDDIVAAFDALKAKGVEVGEALQQKWQEFKDLIGGFVAMFKDKLEEPMEKAKDKVVELFDSMREGIKTAIDKIKGFVTGLIDKVKDLISWFQDSTFGKAISAIAGVASGAAGSVGDWLGQGTGLENRANGGFIGGPEGAPRLALVHGGELVLNRPQQAAMGSTFNVTINGNVDDPQQMARLIANEVDAVIGRNALRNEQVRSR